MARKKGDKDKLVDGKPDPKIVKELSNLLKSFVPVAMACNQVGISQDTYYNWLKKFPEFKFEMNNAVATPIARSRQALYSIVVGQIVDEKMSIGQASAKFLQMYDQAAKD